MLTQTAEYALRAAVCLARNPGRPVSSEQLAEVTRIPRRYLHHVLQLLVNHGLVRSYPGPGGGYQLVRAPEEITVLDIVNAVSPVLRIRQCPLGFQGHGLRLCPLHRVLDRAAMLVEEALGSVRLVELLPENQTESVLCKSPSPISQPRVKLRRMSHAGNPNPSARASRH